MVNNGMRITLLARLIIITLLFGFTWSCTIKTSRRLISSPDPIKIQDIRVAEGVDKTIIELESEEPILYTSFRLSNPDRLVIEMADVTFGQYQAEIKVASGPVRSIILASSGELDISRIEFELNGLVKTDVRPEGLNIIIEVTRLEKMTGPGKIPQVEAMHTKSFTFFGDEEKKPSLDLTAKAATDVIREEAIEAPPLVSSLPLVKIETPGTTAEMANKPEVSPPSMMVDAKRSIATAPAKVVTGVRFVQGKTLQLVISSDGRLSPDIFFVGKNKMRLVIDFPGVKTEMTEKRIVGDVSYVKQVRIGKHPNKLRLVLDLKQPVVFAWTQKQTELWLTIK